MQLILSWGAETHKDRIVPKLRESWQHSWGGWHWPSRFNRDWLLEWKMFTFPHTPKEIHQQWHLRRTELQVAAHMNGRSKVFSTLFQEGIVKKTTMII